MLRLSVSSKLGLVAVVALILAGGTLFAQPSEECNCCTGGNGLGCDCQACEEIVCTVDWFQSGAKLVGRTHVNGSWSDTWAHSRLSGTRGGIKVSQLPSPQRVASIRPTFFAPPWVEPSRGGA